jgi:hypothetical protein
MSGAFAKWQPAYAEHGIATFPVEIIDNRKKPMIKHWPKVGLRGSTKLAAKFTEADIFGYHTGSRSNITVLDIDTMDEKVVEDAIQRHGEPRIITRTASGNRHLLYRYSGERRQIRPWHGLDIDLLGDNGFAIAAPSRLAAIGSYELIHGHLDDLDRLTPMAGVEDFDLPPRHGHLATAHASTVHKGKRNSALYAHGMRHAPHCDDFDALLDCMRTFNLMECETPMADAEVVKTAESVSKYEQAGLNFFSQPRVMLSHDTVDTLVAANSDALALLAVLTRYHGGSDSFALANEMATMMGWGLTRWRAARDLLVRTSEIKCIRSGGRGKNDPPIYGWGIRS